MIPCTGQAQVRNAVSASHTFRRPSLQTSGEKGMEADGCCRAAPAAAEGTGVSCSRAQLKRTQGHRVRVTAGAPEPRVSALLPPALPVLLSGAGP